MIRTSKLTVILLLVSLVESRLVSAQGGRSISLKEDHVPLVKVLQDIREKVGFSYFGDAGWPQVSHPVSLDVNKATLEEVLDMCFRDQPLYYTIDSKKHVINVYLRVETKRDVHGFVYDANRTPVAGAYVAVPGDAGTTTGDNGEFTIHMHQTHNRLVASGVSYVEQEVPLPAPGKDVRIYLQSRIRDLEAVEVHTGYQDIRRGATAGSFDLIDNNLLNRRISTNILDRIDGIASSVLFNKNMLAGVNQSSITIRGRSTIYANPNPLIVVDNFPYPGDFNNINPADVESVTVLKDAAAASIWGAYSGNGVIVITTKQGKLRQTPKISFTSSLTVGQKPDLYYQRILSSSDYIDIEDSLYHWGYYANALALPPGLSGALPPVVEIMDSTAKGFMSSADSAAEVDGYRKIDSRKDLKKYFYQPSLYSQYAINVSGGGEHDKYYLSAGYDQDISNLKRDQYNRLTLMGNNMHEIVPGKLELTSGFAFAASMSYYNNPGGSGVAYPYAPLADAQGNPLPVAKALRLPFVHSLTNGPLLDWHYRPLQEMQTADNKLTLTDYRINLGLRYVIWRRLEARVYYQFGRGDSSLVYYYSPQTYFDRNMVNTYTQFNGTAISGRPVPLGGILDQINNGYTANNVRGQLNYSADSLWHGRLDVIGGWEVRDLQGNDNANWLYGYNPGNGSSVPVDYTQPFMTYPTGAPQLIPYQDAKINTVERYISYYTNAAYTYKDRYMMTASARRDESNLFGVRTNQKGVPLWSAGLAWDISQENWYHFDPIPFLKLRFTDGYNGNVDRNVSAYTTTNINTGVNIYNNVTSIVVNPPDQELRWERIHIYNWGLDFASAKNHFSGTIEYYIKSGVDLIGQSPVDPTTGISIFTGNTADMRDHGLDLTLRTDNSFGPVRWNSSLLFSYVLDKVTKYEEKLGSDYQYMNASTINPLVGKPLYSLYAFRWAGLSADSGNPQGMLNGKITNSYPSILGSTNLGDLIYKGPVNPPVFGSWRNTFYWKQWALSFNILYKFGYVFQRPSIFYSAVFTGNSPGYTDYEKRWQHPGDEKFTHVPSMIYPDNLLRDEFYQASEVLVVKGDHVRLQDVQISYDVTRQTHPKLPVQLLRIYLYGNNLGILWKANHAGIDPDYVNSIPSPRTLALGIKIDY